MACEHCSETNFFLADMEALGPCVCVTPEAMAQLAQDVYEGEGPKLRAMIVERDEALAILGEAGDHFASYLMRQGRSPRALKLHDPDLDALLYLLGT